MVEGVSPVQNTKSRNAALHDVESMPSLVAFSYAHLDTPLSSSAETFDETADSVTAMVVETKIRRVVCLRSGRTLEWRFLRLGGTRAGPAQKPDLTRRARAVQTGHVSRRQGRCRRRIYRCASHAFTGQALACGAMKYSAERHLRPSDDCRFLQLADVDR